MNRPRHPRPDSNHAQVRDDLRESGFVVLDVSRLRGQQLHNPLDLVAIRCCEDMPVIVACSAAGVRAWFDAHPEQKMVQVEVKPDMLADFTENEEAYLRSVGKWPPVYWTKEGANG
jgi:hypothetical protein